MIQTSISITRIANYNMLSRGKLMNEVEPVWL